VADTQLDERGKKIEEADLGENVLIVEESPLPEGEGGARSAPDQGRKS